MIKNHLRIAWRNLIRNRGYAAINIGGLILGITATLLIGLWVHDELSYNTQFENHETIAQVMQHQTFNGTVNTSSNVQVPIAKDRC